jgi:hypothetical protein
MTDYTGNVAGSVVEANVHRSDDALGRWECKKITFTAAGVGNQGTHNLITLPANTFVAGGYFIITTKIVSDSNNGTGRFGIGSIYVHAAFTADGTECDAKDVIQFFSHDFEDAAASGLYVTSADTFDLTIATNDFTAGEGYLLLNIVDLYDE